MLRKFAPLDWFPSALLRYQNHQLGGRHYYSKTWQRSEFLCCWSPLSSHDRQSQNGLQGRWQTQWEKTTIIPLTARFPDFDEILTLPNYPMVLHYKHLSRNKNIFHLFQQLWSKAGDGDLFCLHERGEGWISATCRVGQAPKNHRPNQGGGGTQGYDWW